MALDTETVFLLHFKAEIWREREFNGDHIEFQDGNRDGYLALRNSPSFKLYVCQFSRFCQKSERFLPLASPLMLNTRWSFLKLKYPKTESKEDVGTHAIV